MKIDIRVEQVQDYRKVEELTREAFWNNYCPGCDEHYLAHILRDCDAFIPELDLVALITPEDGSEPILAGYIMYCNASIEDEAGKQHPVITFGPLSVLPLYQSRGIGAALIGQTKQIAKEMGHRLIVIYGDPAYYQRFGFVAAENYGIRSKDGYFTPALQICELEADAMQNVSGKFIEGKVYEIDKAEAGEFDKAFPAWDKGFKPSQLRFQELIAQSHL